MSFPKFFAVSLFTLSLLISHAYIHADFSALTEQSRTEIKLESAVAGLVAGVVAGSLALVYDISSQNDKQKTTLQKLKNVNWTNIVAASVGGGALGALACGVYKYYKAPEWVYNKLANRFKERQQVDVGVILFVTDSDSTDSAMKAVIRTDGLEFLAKKFPSDQCTEKLNVALSSLKRLNESSQASLALVKNDLAALSESSITQVAAAAKSTISEIDSWDFLKGLNDKVKDWISNIKNNPNHYQQLFLEAERIEKEEIFRRSSRALTAGVRVVTGTIAVGNHLEKVLMYDYE